MNNLEKHIAEKLIGTDWEIQRAKELYNDKEKMKKMLVDVNFLLRQMQSVTGDIEGIQHFADMKIAVALLEVENAELKQELEIYKEEFKKINKALNLEEGIVEPYTVDIIEGLKRCVTQQKAELETYKKIAEKLAEELSKHIWLNDKDAIIKIYREKVEEDETHS